jgi:hypothetical protein
MVLQANATDGGASPRAALGYVIAVDRIASTVTVASSGFGGGSDSDELASWASDFLVVQGDNNMKVSGLPAWLLSSAPSRLGQLLRRQPQRRQVAACGGYFNGANVRDRGGTDRRRPCCSAVKVAPRHGVYQLRLLRRARQVAGQQGPVHRADGRVGRRHDRLRGHQDQRPVREDDRSSPTATASRRKRTCSR